MTRTELPIRCGRCGMGFRLAEPRNGAEFSTCPDCKRRFWSVANKATSKAKVGITPADHKAWCGQ